MGALGDLMASCTYSDVEDAYPSVGSASLPWTEDNFTEMIKHADILIEAWVGTAAFAAASGSNVLKALGVEVSVLVAKRANAYRTGAGSMNVSGPGGGSLSFPDYNKLISPENPLLKPLISAVLAYASASIPISVREVGVDS